MMELMDMPILKWQTRWMQDMGDILIRIAEQNGWPTSTPLPDTFKRFPLQDEENNGEDDDDEGEEETPIVPPNYK